MLWGGARSTCSCEIPFMLFPASQFPLLALMFQLHAQGANRRLDRISLVVLGYLECAVKCVRCSSSMGRIDGLIDCHDASVV